MRPLSDLRKAISACLSRAENCNGRSSGSRLGFWLPLESIRYYLDFFRYGCPPLGGFGFRLTRMLMILLGFSNVREVTYLYRGPRRLTP